MPVGHSTDLTRILNLYRRPVFDLTSVQGDALVELLGKRLGRDNPACKCADLGRPCIRILKPVQAWALYEAPLAAAENGGGLAGIIGVGSGKTGLDILMPMVMHSKLTVLLIPPGLREQLIRDYQAWSQHFKVPSLVLGTKGWIIPDRPVVHAIPFSMLSNPKSTALLEQLRPDLIIVDEAHSISDRKTARTGRVLRYFANHPETRLCFWSGTVSKKSVKDYGHLAALALREGSPLPLDPDTLEAWAMAIDPVPWPAPLGELERLCLPGEHIHKAYHRRLVETRGVVSTKEGAIDASIYLHERKAPAIPVALADHLKMLRGQWIRPDGEELVDILRVTSCARELACGFYYRWRFPRGESESLILDWFARRQAWNRELRAVLKLHHEHMDSELLATNAAIRAYNGYKGDLPVWHADYWLPWKEIKDRVYHESETVWVDPFLAQDAADWALAHRGVVWYEHAAFGSKVAALAGLPLHAGGPNAEKAILAEKGDRSIIASINAHGQGRDGLQYLFRDQLIANPPASGAEVEQLLGRLHRIGQVANEVDAWWYRHTVEMRDAFDKSYRLARYIEDTLGTYQKLLSATVTWPY